MNEPAQRSRNERLAAVDRFVDETRMGRGECIGYESTLLGTLREYARLLDKAEATSAPNPVAWRLKNTPESDWRHLSYPPAGVGPEAVVEPLYTEPRCMPSESGRMAEAERLLGEWLKKSDAHRPEIQEFKGGYQPFLERATRYFLDACKRNEPEWP